MYDKQGKLHDRREMLRVKHLSLTHEINLIRREEGANGRFLSKLRKRTVDYAQRRLKFLERQDDAIAASVIERERLRAAIANPVSPDLLARMRAQLFGPLWQELNKHRRELIVERELTLIAQAVIRGKAWPYLARFPGKASADRVAVMVRKYGSSAHRDWSWAELWANHAPELKVAA